MVFRTDSDLRPEEMTIVAVMGVTGVGKSTFIKHATGQDVVIGHGQEACMSAKASNRPKSNWL